MRIGATSDLHGYLPEVPADLDLLLLAGDIGVLTTGELENFGHDQWGRDVDDLRAWIENAGVPIIAVAGNHDFGLAGPEGDVLANDLPWTYLKDETITYRGLKIHGTPWTPTYGPWAFMEADRALAERWALIPDDVDILITHGPPVGVMDVGYGGVPAGSTTLGDRLKELRPKLHVFGHIHGSRGVRISPDIDRITANVAFVNEEYQPLGITHKWDL